MADDSKIEIQIVLDDGSIQKGFATIENKAKTSADNISESFSGKNLFGPLVAAAATAAASIASAFVIVKKGISESIEAENALTKFNISLANSGKFSDEASERFQNYAATLQKIVGIDNDVIISNAALLVSVGKLSGEGLEKATRAAIDLSKGLGISLDGAFELVSKAASGSTEAFSRYGIRIEENLPKNEKFARTLDLINQKFGGLAQGLSESTFSGVSEKLSLSVNNLFEKIGDLFTKSPVIRQTIKFISELVDRLTGGIESAGKKDIVGSIVKQLADAAIFISKYILPVIEVFSRSFVTGLYAIKFALDAVFSGLVGLAGFLVKALIAPFQGLIDLAGSTISLVNKDLGEKLVEISSTIDRNLNEPIDAAFEATKETAAESFQALSDAASKTFSTDLSTSVQTGLENYRMQIEGAKTVNEEFKNSIQSIEPVAVGVFEGVSGVIGGFKAQAKDFAASANANFAQAGRTAFTSFANGVGGAFANVGKAIKNGNDALAAFGDALLQTIGNIAIQLGTTFIAQGIAYIFAGLPNGPALIGAGAALATIGGVISATGGGSAAPASASNGGGVGGGGVFDQPSNPGSDIVDTPAEPAKPQTRIEVNINGSIFDSTETGSRIVSLINDAFDQQGVEVTRGAS